MRNIGSLSDMKVEKERGPDGSQKSHQDTQNAQGGTQGEDPFVNVVDREQKLNEEAFDIESCSDCALDHEGIRNAKDRIKQIKKEKKE